ncbi:DUF6879 family protein [Streptomyces sp. NPDC005955]|uniref:DUF6879 family protein n=1 Tax=Streptomyces sp. NPDC005955 TaxID=3364738 RepID=UPI003675059F
MARQLRFNGTDSRNGACPAVHEDVDSDEIIVQGRPLTDPADLAQLQHFGPGDAAVAVPRELLVNHGTGTAPMDIDSDWCRNITSQTSAGKYVGRVRVIDQPPTEDARCVWRQDAERAHLPAEDFWLFDSRLVAILRFDDEDAFHDVEVITEPAEVLRYCQVRDRATRASVPYDQFAARLALKG